MREFALIVHFIGLTMGLGTGFAQAFLGIAASKMTPEEAIKFRMHTLVLSKMGHSGLGLLIVSGLYLITPYWGVLSSMPLLMLKLALVIALVVMISMIGSATKKLVSGQGSPQLVNRMATMGKISLTIGIVIVIVAVSVFH